MAPKSHMWRRPYTAIYNDNYRFGNSLYASAILDLDRKYQDTIARIYSRARGGPLFSSYPSTPPSRPTSPSFGRPLSRSWSSEDLSRRVRSSSADRYPFIDRFDIWTRTPIVPSSSYFARQLQGELSACEERLEHRRRYRRNQRRSMLEDIARSSSYSCLPTKVLLGYTPDRSILNRCYGYRFHWDLL